MEEIWVSSCWKQMVSLAIVVGKGVDQEVTKQVEQGGGEGG